MFIERAMTDLSEERTECRMHGPWRLSAALTILFLLVSGIGLAQSAADDRPYGIEKRVKWTTSRIVGSPDPPAPYRLVRAFPQFIFNEPDRDAHRREAGRSLGRLYIPLECRADGRHSGRAAALAGQRTGFHTAGEIVSQLAVGADSIPRK